MGAKNELAIGDTITIESIIGTTMDVSIESRLDYGGFPAVIPRVSGTSFFTGMNRFFMDPDDDIGEGFFLK
jgi:trans-L-3-hydroxyproline dehydratase